MELTEKSRIGQRLLLEKLNTELAHGSIFFFVCRKNVRELLTRLL